MKNSGLQTALIGQELSDGWIIDEPRPRTPSATGACHCLTYWARNPDGQRAFVKVLDPTPNEALEPVDQLHDLQRRLAIFNYERDLLDKCLSKKMRRVVEVLGYGSFKLAGYPSSVFYLMFEVAERDLREHAGLGKTLDTALNLNVLHQTALSLEALHFNNIAHQDIKPSNVLLFENLFVKLGDLGSAHDKSISRPGNEGIVAGDPGYAPPEQLYGYSSNEWATRRLASDLYLFGSLIVYMFSDVSMTAQISGQLRPEHHWKAWTGKKADVLPYINEAWDAVLDELIELLDDDIGEELITIVRYLTNPDPDRRGHPRNLAGSGPMFGVRRFSSRLERLTKIAERRIRREVLA